MTFVISLILLLASKIVQAEVYLTKNQFQNLVTSNLATSTSSQPANNEKISFKSKTLWLKKPIQSDIKKILNHPYPKLRLRYKISQTSNNPTTIWYLEEIGKERPISFGVSVKNNRIQMIRVLEFRESRGYEIHIPAFVKQFLNIGVDQFGRLDKSIDGITGATMSVNAMKKITKVALLLHKALLKKTAVKNKATVEQR